MPTIDAHFEIRCKNLIGALLDFFPEHSLSIRHIRDRTMRRDIERQHLRKYIVVSALMSRKDKLVCRNTICNALRLLWLDRDGLCFHDRKSRFSRHVCFPRCAVRFLRNGLSHLGVLHFGHTAGLSPLMRGSHSWPHLQRHPSSITIPISSVGFCAISAPAT